MNKTATQHLSEQSETYLIDRYIAAWNETDPSKRRQLVSQTWTEDSSYIDPMMQAKGRDGIDAMVAQAQRQFPGFRFRRVTEVDAHNNCVRFGWELGPERGAAVAGGVDFGTIGQGGLLQSITGFVYSENTRYLAGGMAMRDCSS